MQPNRFVISDSHFGHKNCLTFIKEDKTPLRSFSCIEDMDEYMVQKWNSVVKDQDVVYHLGDVTLNKRNLPIISRLKGSKRLIKGNHDIYGDDLYTQYFTRIYTMRIFKDMILTHIPIHPDSVERFGLNIHGHIHAFSIDDPRYLNVCVDFGKNDYTPINMEDIRSKM